MTNMKAAERAAELANAVPGSDGGWDAKDFLYEGTPSDDKAFVQFIADADAAARKAREYIDNQSSPIAVAHISDLVRLRDTLSPFILPDDVDPLLIEARKLGADMWATNTTIPTGAINAVRTGHDDKNLFVVAALTALRRGMELAKEQGK